MMNDAELEAWCQEQSQDDDVEPGETGKERLSVRASLSGGDGYREMMLGSGEIRCCVSFRVWTRPASPLGNHPSKPSTSVVCEFSRVKYSLSPSRTDAAEDLDEWLQVAPLKREGWRYALDDCLRETARGETSLFETVEHGGWIVEATLEEIYVERLELVDVSSARAVGFGPVNGYAKSRRIIGATGRAKEVADGCVVHGIVVVERSSPGALVDPSLFGVEGEWSSAGEESTMRAVVGDGSLSEGFEAALVKCCVEGSTHRIVVAGECLSPDDDDREIQGEIVVDVTVVRVDDSSSRKDVMSMSMDDKEARAVLLKERGARLWARGRFRRAELVWNSGVRLFNFIKPEDSGMDPNDEHLKENQRGRLASIPLLLNEALAMRKRGSAREAMENLNEAIENDGNHVKALFRRGQLHVDAGDLYEARDDFRRCRDLGGPAKEIDVELKRIKKEERRRDARDGKHFKRVFDDEIYSEKTVDAAKMAKRREELRAKKTYSNDVVKKKIENATDWTKSYDTKSRPKVVTDDGQKPEAKDVVVVDSLEAELEEIQDEEEDALRQAKQDYYNSQIALGNMKLHLPDNHR